MNNGQIKKVAVAAAKEAGKKLLKEFAGFDRNKVRVKSKGQLVSYADLLSEKIIISAIKKSFPDHDILSEEMGAVHQAGQYLWVIDPIDGTTNFTMRNPLWCISIGVIKLGKTDKDNQLVCGVIYAPVMDEMFTAEPGKGAYLNSKKLKVSNVKDMDKSLNGFCYGSGDDSFNLALDYYFQMTANGIAVRQFGSAAIELAYVAAGRLDSIVIPGAKAWDVAAGVLMVREAGGVVTDQAGKKWGMESRMMIGDNKLLHRRILSMIKK